MDRRTFLRATLVASVAGCTPTADPPDAARDEPATASPSPATSPAAPRSTTPPATPGTSAAPSPSAPRQRLVVTRDLLGLPTAAGGGQSHDITGLMLHHTAAPTVPAPRAPDRFRSHARSHRDAGFVDVAYHWGVDTDGTVYQLRDEAIAGETFTDYDPAGWLLVVCEGNFEESRPPQAMLEAVADVFAARATALDVDPTTLVGHREVAATACPGINLQERLADITRMIQRRAGEVELALTDDPAALP